MESYLDTAPYTNAFLLTYEFLTDHKTVAIQQIIEHLNYPIAPTYLTAIAEQTSFKNMKQRSINSTNDPKVEPTHISPYHFNHGKIGESRKRLTESHVAMVNKIVNTQFPNLRSKITRKTNGIVDSL